VNGEELFLTVMLFLIVGGVIWKWIDSIHKQRMAMIEKGLSSVDLAIKSRPGSPLPVLKWGLVAIFVGSGLLLGIILHRHFNVDEAVTPVLALITGGLALVVYYRVASTKIARGE
jgi:hypothetical protein